MGAQTSVIRVGLEGIPPNGQPEELFAHHGLTSAALGLEIMALSWGTQRFSIFARGWLEDPSVRV